MQPKANSESGFTLLEVMASVLVIAIMVAGVAISFHGPIVNARETNFKEQILNRQRICREECNRFGQTGVLTIDQNVLVWDFGNRTKRIALGNSCRIDATIVEGQARKFDKAKLYFDFQGISENFAVHVVNQRNQSYWLFVTGGTGDSFVCHTEAEVFRIFDEIQKTKN